MHHPYYALLLISFLSLGVARSQTTAPDYLFFHLDVSDGLASNFVNEVIQDHEGFWWIATNNGLQRFDGKRFTTFFPERGPGYLPGTEQINAIFEDRQNFLWIWTDRGIYLYDFTTKTFFPYTLDKGPLETGHAGKFFQDSGGRIWLMAEGLGLFCLSPGQQDWSEITHPSFKSRFIIGSVAEEPLSGDIWIAHGSGITRIEHASGKITNSKTDPGAHPVFFLVDDAQCLFIDAHHNLWISDYDIPGFQAKGTFSYNLLTNQHQRFFPGFFCKGIIPDRSGNLWFGSVNGNNYLGVFNDATGRLTQLPYRPKSLFQWDGDGSIFPSCLDREGNLWFASSKGIYIMNPGAQRIQPVRFVTGPKGETRELALVGTFFESRDGEIWVGTYFNGIYVFDQNLQLLRTFFFPKPEEVEFNAIWTFCQDASGDIWAGGQHGTLLRFDASGHLLEKTRPLFFQHQTIRFITKDTDGNLWFATQKGLLIKREGADHSFHFFSRRPDILFSHFYASVQEEDTLWVSNADGALCQLDLCQEKILGCWYPQGASSEKGKHRIHGIYPWDDHTLLVYGNPQYLFHKKSKTFSSPISPEGLPSPVVRFVQKTDADKVWLGTESGLACWNPNTEKVMTYGLEDGIPSSLFMGSNPTIQLRDGRILTSAEDENGFSAFHPDSLVNRLLPQKTHITDIQVFNKSLPGWDSLWRQQGHITLNHRQNFLTIHFVCPTWFQKNRLTYRYRLKGYDPKWVENWTDNFASYTGLPPGRYSFEVQAVSREEASSRELTTLSVWVSPPYWQTWWFAALVFLCLAGLLRRIHVYQRKRREHFQQVEAEKKLALEMERQRIARDMHDDLGSGLSALNLLTELARQKSTNRKVREEIEGIGRQTQELSVRIREIVWTINSRNDSLENMLSYLHQHAVSFFEPTGIQLNAHWPEHIPDIKIPGENRRHLYLAFKEALHNIVKHSGATEVWIDFCLEGSRLEVSVRDNGKGFDIAHNIYASGSGLKNMAERMKQAGGRFQIASGPGGTALILELPV
jgi:signal transduction histidine kinase/ligand-binding sensor domain-containing protein